MEREQLHAALRQQKARGLSVWDRFQVETCGFGLVAAAAMTMRHLSLHRPSRVVLAGIAGSLGPECKVGSAYWFGSVVCDGIGVGEADSFQSAATLGWNQLDGGTCGAPIADRLDLVLPVRARPVHARAGRAELGLVSRCAASANRPAAMTVRRRVTPTHASGGTDPVAAFSYAAEDMEGFAVALACQIAGVPVSIVRGISNEAGDRNHAGWQIDSAIAGIAESLIEYAHLAPLVRGEPRGNTGPG
ncbi:Futalosine hydrolase [Allorhodopirellula solitaria]|uniref:Futalosine hydrolase n=2 Tax=Allorhodopirellula solitaria TaxID=2527987 RepID=A0A5C5YKA3_9BACT|nr:Futalosine hydrolase [Allorhodopirellula solitaria]